jgi:hypothetical protein
MAEARYCWRCRTVVPMFDEAEWEKIHAELTSYRQSIKNLRESTGGTIEAAVAEVDAAVIRLLHFELTGVSVSDPEALWHHRLADCGEPCRACGKPLRTRIARFCAECGVAVV